MNPLDNSVKSILDYTTCCIHNINMMCYVALKLHQLTLIVFNTIADLLVISDTKKVLQILLHLNEYCIFELFINYTFYK